MSYTVIDLECPGCGYPITPSTTQCPMCSRPIYISTFNSVDNMDLPSISRKANAYAKELAGNPADKGYNMSAAFCYLKLKLYAKANSCFEKAIEDNFDNSGAFFYAAISLLEGKKAFLVPRKTIDKAEEYLQAAIMIEPKGIYYYFWAYLRYDHHFRKFYNVKPDYKTLLAQAHGAGVSNGDIAELYKVLAVDRPSLL